MKFDEPTKFRLLQISAFKTWFANQLVRVGKDLVSLGDYWLSARRSGGNMPASSSRHRARRCPTTSTISGRGLPVEPQSKATARNSWRT